MPLTPKAIYKDLKNKDLDINSAIELLITLIENTENINTRLESLNILEKIRARDEKIFKLLENLLISDSNENIRNVAAYMIQKFFIDRALGPMKWALEHEKGLKCLITIISTFSKIDTVESKSLLIDKIYNYFYQENKYNLKDIRSITEIEDFNSQRLAELLINYHFIMFLKKKFGFIKYEFDNLGYITKLDLTNVDPQGIYLSNFLDLIDSLKHLNTLDLRFNNLTKLTEISSESFSLKSLDLSYNKLINIPKSIDKIKSLEELNLKSNRLRSLPNSLKNLSSLQNLNLRNNMFTHIPLPIKSFKFLRILDLHGNKLNSVNFQMSSSIKDLELGWNNFTEVPQKIKSLNSLEKLGFSGNKLKSLPKWISNFQSLKLLDLYDNLLYTLTSSLGLLESLENLVLRNNQLTTLPESMKNLKRLKKLNLSWNNFSFLPEWIGELSSLEELNLWGNKLENLPKSIYFLSNLKLIDLNFNKIEKIPEFLIELKERNGLIIKI